MKFTSTQVAKYLGLTKQQVCYLARRHCLGKKFGRVWMFSDEDIQKMKNRPHVGRPRSPK